MKTQLQSKAKLQEVSEAKSNILQGKMEGAKSWQHKDELDNQTKAVLLKTSAFICGKKICFLNYNTTTNCIYNLKNSHYSTQR